MADTTLFVTATISAQRAFGGVHPALAIVDAEKRSKRSRSVEWTLSSTSAKTVGSGCGDKALLGAEKSRFGE